MSKPYVDGSSFSRLLKMSFRSAEMGEGGSEEKRSQRRMDEAACEDRLVPKR